MRSNVQDLQDVIYELTCGKRSSPAGISEPFPPPAISLTAAAVAAAQHRGAPATFSYVALSVFR